MCTATRAAVRRRAARRVKHARREGGQVTCPRSPGAGGGVGLETGSTRDASPSIMPPCFLLPSMFPPHLKWNALHGPAAAVAFYKIFKKEGILFDGREKRQAMTGVSVTSFRQGRARRVVGCTAVRTYVARSQVRSHDFDFVAVRLLIKP